MSTSSSDAPTGASEILHEIDTLISELARLARSEIPPQQFYAQVLQRTQFVLHGQGAGIWTVGAADEIELAYRHDLSQLTSRRAGRIYEREKSRLEPLVISSQPALLTANGEEGLSHWVVAAPVQVEQQTWGILAIYFAEEMPAAVQEGFIRFVAEVARIAGQYQQRQQIAGWRQGRDQWRGYADYSLAVHRGWSLKQVAFEVANEGRRYVGCDRVSVALLTGRRCKLLAVSGIDAVHKHANLVRKLEKLTKAVIKSRQPLLVGDQEVELPPQIEKLLQDYLDEGATRSLAIVPLFHPQDSDQEEKRSPGAPFGATICEQFRSSDLELPVEVLQSLNQHASLALSRAKKLRSVPLLGFLAQHARAFSWLRLQMWPLWAIAAGVLGLIVALLALVQTDFDVAVRGELLPAVQRHVFAAQDGTIDQVHVEHDQHVKEGELLVELSSNALDLEFQRVTGEMEVARTERAALRTEQLQATGFDARTADQLRSLSARELALGERLENLNAQLKILEKQRAELKLISPIGGRVLTWDVESELLARPIRRGDTLLTVADTDGPWIVRLHVPDESVGHLRKSQAEQQGALKVSFVAVADPSVTIEGTVKSIGTVSQMDPTTDTSGVFVDVAFEKSQVAGLRSNAAVVGRVHCGRRSVGYVWLHELFEEFDRRFF